MISAEPQITGIYKTARISADTIFYPEIQHADKKREHIVHMIQLCDERDLQVVMATVKALLDTK